MASDSRPRAGGASIVIVTFDAEPGMLEAAVDSVLDSITQAATPLDVEVGVEVEVVDNGNQAAARLAHLGNRVTITTTGANHGFAAAVNLGFRHGIDRGARFLVCLNDDVVVSPTWWSPLIRALDADPGLGGVQPLLLDPHTELIDSAGVQLDRFGAGSDRLRGAPRDRARAEAVTALTGGAMMVRAEAFEAVGEFDERFFLYYEDVEWCLRAAANGWRFAVEPESVVYHRGSATTARLGDDLLLLQDRNRLWNAALHAGPSQLLAALSLSVRRLRHRPYGAHRRALVTGFVGMTPRLLQRRRSPRSSR